MRRAGIFTAIVASLLGVSAAGCLDYGPYYRTPAPLYREQCPPVVIVPNNSAREDISLRMRERAARIENARTSPLIYADSERVRRRILEETRGADFNNPIDRQHALERAAQIREQEWRRQTAEWNRQLEARGYTRKH